MFRKIIAKNSYFEISKENKNGLFLFSIKNFNNNNKITIISNYGASIKDLIFNKNSKSYNIVPSLKSIKEYKKSFKYFNSILFPFPNRINKGIYEFNGNMYHLKIEDFESHALHGLVYDKEFYFYNSSISEDNASISFIYNYNGKIKGYPFLYDLIVEYILCRDNKLICNFSIISKENKLPFGFGFHPYFRFNDKIDKLYLKLGDVIKYELDSNMIPIGKYSEFKEFLDYKQIEERHFDSLFKINYDKLYLSLYNKEEEIKINIYENNTNYLKYFQIYTHPKREIIALEPMTCNIDVFNNRDGLIILDKDESINISLSIELD